MIASRTEEEKPRRGRRLRTSGASFEHQQEDVKRQSQPNIHEFHSKNQLLRKEKMEASILLFAPPRSMPYLHKKSR